MHKLLIALVLSVALPCFGGPARKVIHKKGPGLASSKSAIRANKNEFDRAVKRSNERLSAKKIAKKRTASIPGPLWAHALQFAVGQVAEGEVAPELNVLDMGEDASGARTLRTFFSDVLYQDRDGTLQLISPELVPSPNEANPSTYSCSTVSVPLSLDPQGIISFGSLTMHLESFGTDLSQTMLTDVRSPDIVATQESAEELTAGDLIPGADVRWVSTGSGLKEDIVLRSMPDLPASSKAYQLVWAFDALPGAPSLTDDGGVSFYGSKIILTKITVSDSARRHAFGTYSLTNGKLVVQVDADWLRSAAYPVTIDPTQTISSNPGNHTVTCDPGGTARYGSLFFGVDLPDIGAGSVLGSATLYMKKTGGITTVSSQTVKAYTADYRFGWNGASVLNSNIITNGYYTNVTQPMGTAQATGTVYQWSVTGVSSNADCVAAAYAAASNPDIWSFGLHIALRTAFEYNWSSTAQTTQYPLDDRNGYYVELGWTGNPTFSNRPYLEIVYTPGATAVSWWPVHKSHLEE